MKKVLPVADTDILKKMGATLQNAQDFMNAHRVLQAHNRTCKQTTAQPVFTADVVNLIFGIELLFKALLYCAGKKVKSHKLNELYKLLPSQTQSEIKEAFTKHLVKASGNSKDIFGLIFERRLEQYADSYQHWRYFHEYGQGTFNSKFCEDLAYVLNEIAQDKVNDLYINMNVVS